MLSTEYAADLRVCSVALRLGHCRGYAKCNVFQMEGCVPHQELCYGSRGVIQIKGCVAEGCL